MYIFPIHPVKQIFHKLRSTLEYRILLYNPIFRDQIARIKSFENKHRGERCFIIGNGPSLRVTDLSKLKNEITFGQNRIYLLFEELGFSTSYYICVNRLVLSQFSNEINSNILVPKFTVWDQYDIANKINDIHFIFRHNGSGFYSDITKGLWGGGTVTYASMQIAFFMGFENVILVGVDHSFSTRGRPNETVTSDDDDPNHFSPNYFGKGVKWQLPDLETSEYAYSLAHKAYQEAGRMIQDATIGGNLKIFPKVDFDNLWK